ncbi:hypothetical protein Mapa_005696 [Marchantia paleacea]|nr:hypothetical protein Mapa_005696 [Marchantia paleacea]
MKGTQICINKAIIKAIKVVQHLGDASSKSKAEKKLKEAEAEDLFDTEDSPRAPHEFTSNPAKHGKWTTKCIKAGGKGKAGADRLLKAAKGRTLSQVLSQTSRRLEAPSYAHALGHAQHAHASSTAVDHKPPHSTAPPASSSKASKALTSDPPIQILMWIGDQHIDIGKTLVPY